MNASTSPNVAASATATFELDGRYSWTRLAVSVVLATVGSAGMWSVVLVMPAVEQEFAIARADAALPYTATMIGFALGNLLLGRVVDRFGITPCLILAAVMLGAGFAGAAMTHDIVAFSLLQGALIGIGTSASFGPLIADVSHWFRRRRGIAVAAAASGNYLAGAIWPMVLKDIVAEDGWRAAYFVVAATCIVVMIPLALMLRRRIPPDAETDPNTVGRDPRTAGSVSLSPRALQWLLAIAGIGCCVAMSMPQVHIVALCADLGYGVTAGAEMLSIMVAGGVVSRLASGFLADHIGGVRTLILGSILQMLALMLYLPFDGLTSLYVVSLVFGLSQGGIVPSYAIIVREYLPAREAGRRVGTVIMATVIGMALGGWLSGLIYDWTGSYQAAFINGIAFNALNIAVIALVLWRTKEAPPLGAA
ncbi:MFS transporter [Pararhizobium haloflavum]|uniref:MFS transporter n=1 Tax=Pararhizobium haloflavum TaxID=2037914 RepID=UPI001FE079AB|nr:MFS transporter [Pararhizobium haloflavum]